MSAIKKFFEKRKLEIKFKRAGDGHSLTEEKKKDVKHQSSTSGSSSSQHHVQSAASSRAAEAAILRTNQSKNPKSNSTGVTILRSEVKSGIEAERQRLAQLSTSASQPKELELEGAPVLTGAYFKCPIAGPAVLPRSEIDQYIENFLFTQLDSEPELTSALIIQTLNKDREQVKACSEILAKYINNVIQNPTENKFWKIRVNNKIFRERVQPIRGACNFLEAAGFRLVDLPSTSSNVSETSAETEQYYVITDEYAADTDRLSTLVQVLSAAEPILPELDRGTRVYRPSSADAISRIFVPDDFYNVSAEEIRREQKLRTEAVEQFGMLVTKEMRERQKQRELRRYRYALIRVRFPDGLVLQGTFRTREKLSAVYDFVQECLKHSWIPFQLKAAAGKLLDLTKEKDQSIAELDLAPAAILNFNWDQDMLRDISTADSKNIDINKFLSDELIDRIEPP